jgi:hypothetical protein
MSDIVPWSPESFDQHEPSGCFGTPLLQTLGDLFGAWKTERSADAAIKSLDSERGVLEAKIRLAKTRLQGRQELAELMTAAERSQAAYQLAHTILSVEPEFGRALLDDAILTEQRWLDWEAVRSRIERKQFLALEPAQPSEPEIAPLLDDATVEACAAQLAARAQARSIGRGSRHSGGAKDELAEEVGEHNSTVLLNRAHELMGGRSSGLSGGISPVSPVGQADHEEPDLSLDDF